MERFLVVVGCQKEKLDGLHKKDRQKLLDFVVSSQCNYSDVVSIIRVPMNGDSNFKHSGNTMSNTSHYLDYPSNSVIEVPGYDVDCSQFRRDVTYDIVGISTSSSVLCIAMSMYSNGLRVNILSKYCFDRKSDKLGEYAIKIMETWMPNCVK